jgi:hypothetical protein
MFMYIVSFSVAMTTFMGQVISCCMANESSRPRAFLTNPVSGLSDKAEDFGNAVKDRIDDLSPINKIVASTMECHAYAIRTVELCESTFSTRSELATCRESIRSLLLGGGGELNAESFRVRRPD